MTNSIKNIAVYCSSSNELDSKYYQDAELLGTLIGQEGFNLVYGGSILGMMGISSKSAKKAGGQVFGVIPEKLHKICAENENCDELHVTKCMRTRKEKLDQISQAVVALAGGFGTLEEVSEMIVQKQLGYTDKAIVFLNTAGFYNNLLKFFDDMLAQKFAHKTAKDLFFVANTPQEAIDYIKNYQPKHFDIYEKLNLKGEVKVGKE